MHSGSEGVEKVEYDPDERNRTELPPEARGAIDLLSSGTVRLSLASGGLSLGWVESYVRQSRGDWAHSKAGWTQPQ